MNPAATIQELLAALGVSEWDCLIVGDGAGSKWGLPVGWSAVLLEKDAMVRRVFYGCCNDATVNFAELAAYLAPLTWYTAKVNHQRSQGGSLEPRHVHIITDSQYVQQGGEDKKAIDRVSNSILFAAFALIQRKGFRLHWHWLRRESTQLNQFTDALSKIARQQLVHNDLAAGWDVNTANPWE